MNAVQPPPKFGRDTFAVRIENIAPCVGRHEVIELFSNLIGQVRKCEEHITDEDGRYMEMAFFNRDCSRKALCMSGYTVAGVPLSVSAIAPQPNLRRYDRSNQVDDRRNLYVLGLPFNLTKTEFTELFSRYGTVVHSVILATVDSGSRRRGFIVMSTHTEAKAAMDSLSRAEIKNHIIDVSWAVVQRSQGFLDGGDRTATEAPARSQPILAHSAVSPGLQVSYPPSYSQPQTTFPVRYPAPVMSSPFAFPMSAQPWPRGTSPVAPNTRLPPALSLSPTSQRVPVEASSTLLVKDLPAVLFASEADLCPLFVPFGDVRRIELIKTSMLVDMDSDMMISKSDDSRRRSGELTRDQDSVSAIVEYSSTLSAREAYQALHGQVYESCKVSVEFFERPTTSSSSSSLASSMTFDSSTSFSSSELTPSSSMSSFGDVQNDDRLLAPAYHPFKRHSVAALGGLYPTSGRGFGPSYADFNPDSPPQSAKSMGFPERVSFAEGSYFERTYDALGGPFNERATDRDRLERERQYERELAFGRRTTYDRSNNTSPFHGGRGYLAPNQPTSSYAPPLQGQGAAAMLGEMSRETENKFGAIARPSSSIARFPPGQEIKEREMQPPASALAKTKFDELMNSEFSHGALGRGGRMFQSMPDVFDFPSGAALPANA